MNKWIFLGLLLTCSAYAFRRGGAPERVAAAMILAAVAATIAAGSSVAAKFFVPMWGVLAVDLALMAGLMGLAVRADRFWPILMAALVGLGLFGHLAAIGTLSMQPLVYAISHAASGYPVLLLLAVATARHRRRKTETGSDAAWRS